MNATSPPTTFTRRMVAGNIAALFSGSAVSQGMTALALLLTARQLGVIGYGQYSSSIALASMTAIVFNLGMDIWLLREGAHEPKRLGVYVGSVLSIKAIAGLVWFIVLALISPWLNTITSSNSFPVPLVILSAVVVWLDGVLFTLLTTFKALLRNKYTSIIDATSDFVWVLATTALIGLGVRHAVPYMQARAGVMIGTVAIAGILARRIERFKTDLQVTQRIIKETFPYAASEFLAWTSMRVDILILATISGEEAVGLYAPAVSLANALFLVPAAVYSVILPVLSNLFGSHPRQAWLTAGRSLGLLVLLGAVLSVLLYMGSPLLVALLGSSFGGSLEILRILSGNVFIHSLSFGMAAILVAVNQQARRTLVQAAAVGINVLANLIVIPQFGIQGAAWVYVGTEIVLLAGYSALVFQHWMRSRQST